MARTRSLTTAVTAIALSLALALGATACGDDGDDTAATGDAPAAGETRTIETDDGPLEIPASPETVVALDEYAAMNLLAFGIRPTKVWAAYGSTVGRAVLEGEGVEMVEQADSFAVDFEGIDAAEPDLIVFTAEGAFVEQIDRLQEIAPSVVLPYERPWRDAITATGAIVGQEDRAEEIIGVIEARVAEVAATQADDPQSLSILADSFGMIFGVSTSPPLHDLVTEAGFTRPAAQAEGTPDAAFATAIPLSLEDLADHDADVVAVLSGTYYDPDTFLDAPTFQRLPAVEDGRSVVVDGDMWFGTFPFAADWVLDDLAAVLAGEPDGVGDADDVDARWEAFVERLG